MSVGVDCDPDGEPLHLIMHLQDISNYKGHEQKQSVVHDLNERVKELTALHRTARLLQDHERAPGMLLQEIVNILPAAFDQAELAAARIVFDGVEYRSKHFGSSPWTQSARFTTAGGKHGLVEIAYAESGLGPTKLPFLPEEKSLLDSIAEMLQLYLDRKEAQESVERITRELVERNKELWNLQQEMGRVGQAAALGWMTGAIAHELGTPLNSVLRIYPTLSARGSARESSPPCENYREPGPAHGRHCSILFGSHAWIDQQAQSGQLKRFSDRRRCSFSSLSSRRKACKS